VANIKNGAIAATSMQFPLKMAAMGVAAGVKFAKDGKRLTGYTDTGAELITDKPAKGVKGIDTAKASGLCF
jgi:fructose transport system substrate-binding protein